MSWVTLILSLFTSTLPEVINIVKAIETAINESPGSAAHTAAVQTIQTAATKATTPAA